MKVKYEIKLATITTKDIKWVRRKFLRALYAINKNMYKYIQ